MVAEVRLVIIGTLISIFVSIHLTYQLFQGLSSLSSLSHIRGREMAVPYLTR